MIINEELYLVRLYLPKLSFYKVQINFVYQSFMIK